MERRKHLRQAPMIGRAFVYIGKGVPLINCDVHEHFRWRCADRSENSRNAAGAICIVFSHLMEASDERAGFVWRDGFDVGVAFEGLD